MPRQAERHPRLLRLLSIGTGEVGVESLARELGVSIKTIRRDVAAMQALGVAIEEQTHAHGRKTYRLSKQAVRQIKFNYDEALSLILCQASASAFDGTPLGEAAGSGFEKIRAALGPLEQDYVERMLPRIHRSRVGSDYSGHGEIVEALTLGIEESRATFVTYHSARSTEPVTYDIHPYGLAEHRGTLYVVGYSCHRERVQTWKVDRMLDAEVTKVPFTRPRDFDMREHFEGAFAVVAGNQPVRVRVRFTGTAARYVNEKRMHASQQVIVQSDGTAEVTFDLSSTFEIKSWILSFGSAAIVLEPETLRVEIQQELGSAILAYSREHTQK